MFSELNITSNFSFLKGASHPEEYMSRAAALGIEAIAIADENAVAGIVRAHARAREIARQVEERRDRGSKVWADRAGAAPGAEQWSDIAHALLHAASYPGGAAGL